MTVLWLTDGILAPLRGLGLVCGLWRLLDTERSDMYQLPDTGRIEISIPLHREE